MPRINRDDLSAGMTTAEDVHDRNGRLLLSSGTKLTEKHLRVLKLWGVIDVAIRGDGEGTAGDKESVDAVRSGLWEKEAEKMRSLFRHTDLEHPFIKSLFQLCVERKVRSNPLEDCCAEQS